MSSVANKPKSSAETTAATRKAIGILGVPLGYGASMAGVDMGPAALRVARLKQRIKAGKTRRPANIFDLLDPDRRERSRLS